MRLKPKYPLLQAVGSYFYPQLLEVVESPHNGKIQVFRFLNRNYIDVGGLTQSGGLVTRLWSAVITQVSHQFKETMPQRVLILGLGAGSMVAKVYAAWPEASITAVEIDPKMIEVGRKYFGLNHFPQLEVVEADIFAWVNLPQVTYDLILVDIFQGEYVPDEVSSTQFLSALYRLVDDQGIVVINRLDFAKEKERNRVFVRQLETIFGNSQRLKTPVNYVVAAIK